VIEFDYKLIKGRVKMNIYESSEDYLERILILKEAKGHVRSIDIAESMNFSKPSVSVAMKKLRENGYILVDKEGFITLTEKGMAIANHTYEKHKLLSSVLVKLGVSEETAREDACKIEHDLSDETFTAIKNYVEKVKNPR